MAKADSRSITPLPGWPYVVLPALMPAVPESPKQPRARLADNVVALSAHERAPVVNHKWRGRLPRGVIALRLWDRIHVGDYCLIWARGTSPSVNHGRMVRVIGFDMEHRKWRVQAIGAPLMTFDPDHPEDVRSHSSRTTAIVTADRLRRCAKPVRS